MTLDLCKENNINNIIIPTNLLDLPSSWLLHLFCNYFSFSTLLTSLPLVCQQFRTLCSDPNVWKSIKFPITIIRNIYKSNTIIGQPPVYDPDNDNDNGDGRDIEIYTNKSSNFNLNKFYFESFLIRSCRLLQTITFEGSIEENDWHSWNNIMKILGNHSLRQIKWHYGNNSNNIKTIRQYFKYKSEINNNIIDTLFVRCRHISRRGYCWLQSLAYIPTIQHIHCAALSRSDDVQHMIYNFNNLKTLNVNILGIRNNYISINHIYNFQINQYYFKYAN